MKIIYTTISLFLIFVLAGCSIDTKNTTEGNGPNAGSTEFPTQTPSSTPSPGVIAISSDTPIVFSTAESIATIDITSMPATITPQYLEPFIPLPAQFPNGKIYVWSEDGYGILDASENARNPYLYAMRPVQADVGRPDQAFAFAFSRYSGQIAYLSSHDDLVSLWVGNLELTEINQIWVDSEKVLGNLPDYSGSGAIIMWGQHDDYLIIKSILNLDITLIWNKLTNQVIQVTGPCNQVVENLVSGIPGIGCLYDNGSAIILESGDIITATTQYTQLAKDVSYFSFSPDGKRVAFVSGESIFITNHTQGILELPVTYHSSDTYDTQNILVWSQDGERILVFGDTEDDVLCQQKIDPAGGLGSYPCWVVFDTATMQHVWSPGNQIYSFLEIPGDYVYSGGGAAISPFDYSVYSTYLSPPLRFGLISSIESSKVYQILDLTITEAIWVER